MLHATRSPALQSQWHHLTQDQQLSPQKLQAARTQLQAESPGLSEEQIRDQLAGWLSAHSEGLDTQSAQILIERVFQGETLNLQTAAARHTIAPQAVSFFEDPAPAEQHNIRISVSDAHLTDSNGVRSAAADDLSGNIGEISLQTRADSQQMEALLDSVTRQLASQVVQMMGGDQRDPGVMQQIMQQVAAHIDVAPRSAEGQTVFDFNLDPAFSEQLTGWASAGVTVNGWLGAVGLNPYDLSNPLATLSSRDGQLTLDLPNSTVAEYLSKPETRVPDFGEAPPATPMPENAPPADEARMREVLGRIDWPGNDPRRQMQISDRDQRSLMNLYNQGALESLPPALHERAAFWASETAALDAERLLRNWYGNDPRQNAALQQLLNTPAFQSLPAERRNAIIQQGAQTGAEILGGRTPLNESQQALLATLAPHLQPWAETGRPAVAGMLDSALDTLREQGIELAARTDIGTDAHGNPSVQIMPERLTLQGQALQRLLATHPQLAALGDLSNGQLHLEPEHFSVSMGPEGLDVRLRNVSLSGGTDLSSAAAEGNEPTHISIDNANGSVAINGAGVLQNLSLDELTGRLNGDISLDQEVVAAIETRAQQVLSELDTYLSQYGLGREQVQQLLAQLPGNALQQLGSSASQSQINQLAQQFGLGNEQIAGLMNLLQEQPVRQLLDELGGLTQRLGENTRLSGELGFSLQDLNLSAGESGWLASLGQLSLNLNATAEAADGQQTALEGRLDAEAMHIDTTSGSGGSGTVSGSLRAETLSSEAAAAPVPAEQIEAFRQVLANGGGEYREPADGANHRTAGHLRDDHISEGGLRARKGLSIAGAQAELAKAPASRWADMLEASEAERRAFFENNQPPIDPVAGDYLLRYLSQRVINQSPPAPDNQRIAVSGVLAEAAFDPNGLRFGDISGNATLDAKSAGSETNVQVSGQIAGGSASADASGLGPVTVTGSGRFEDAAGRVTDITGEARVEEISVRPESAGPAPAEDIATFAEVLANGGGNYREPASGANGRTAGHLRDDHISAGGLRRGSGLHVNTAQAQLAKAPASRWADMLQASATEQQAFFAEHGIQHGQYLLDYLQRHVVGQSAPEGGLSFSGVHAEGQATATEGGRSATLSVDASIAEARFGQDGATAEDLEANATLDAGDTRMTLAVEADRASSDAGGLTMEAEASWSFEVDGNRAQTEARGSTRVSIADSQIASTHTAARDLSGHVHIDRGLFLDLLAGQNRRMADFFREHGILGQNQLRINVTNTGDIRTGANGEVEAYQILATTAGVNTPYGQAAASLYADHNGSITGNIQITPNDRLAQEVRTQLQAAMRQAAEDLRQNSSPFNNNRANADHLMRAADSLQVTLHNGRFAVSMQGQHYVNFNLDLSVIPNGRSIDIQIDQAQLQNRFLNGLTQALGVDLNRRATQAIQQGLTESGLRPNQQGNYTLSIQTEDLMRRILGPDASAARISPQFAPNGNLDIQYWIN